MKSLVKVYIANVRLISSILPQIFSYMDCRFHKFEEIKVYAFMRLKVKMQWSLIEAQEMNVTAILR